MDDPVEAMAESMWREDYRRATGKERLVTWAEAANGEHERWRGLAQAALNAERDRLYAIAQAGGNWYAARREPGEIARAALAPAPAATPLKWNLGPSDPNVFENRAGSVEEGGTPAAIETSPCSCGALTKLGCRKYGCPKAAPVASEAEFLRRLVENVYSWALEDCNYLAFKDADAIVGATRNGMTPEQAAVWRADRPTAAPVAEAPRYFDAMREALARQEAERRAAAAEQERAQLQQALRGCRTHIAGYNLRDGSEVRRLLDEFFNELQRIDGVARAALAEGKP